MTKKQPELLEKQDALDAFSRMLKDGRIEDKLKEYGLDPDQVRVAMRSENPMPVLRQARSGRYVRAHYRGGPPCPRATPIPTTDYYRICKQMRKPCAPDNCTGHCERDGSIYGRCCKTAVRHYCRRFPRLRSSGTVATVVLTPEGQLVRDAKSVSRFDLPRTTTGATPKYYTVENVRGSDRKVAAPMVVDFERVNQILAKFDPQEDYALFTGLLQREAAQKRRQGQRRQASLLRAAIKRAADLAILQLEKGRG